ncbi:hypothetical protein MLD38_006211 [Melastoma candidum]|uniref:Uncharacterized protein n=1 Tax=Melastoma candidum TaxID=119954 RepID=A0ACB9RM61_9MYRT|nr:hypothetical protein MLD38_006211 [Melastoma candidum]
MKKRAEIESSGGPSSGKSLRDTGSYDLPQGLERFECDYTLPEGLEWCTCDLTVEECCADVCDLLMCVAQELRGDRFVMDFTTDYLRWLCCPPGYILGLHIGVWDRSLGQLVAFISAVPFRVGVKRESSRMAQIRFLTIQSDFRDRIPLDIAHDEITRRIRSENIHWVVQQKRMDGPAPMAFQVWERYLDSRKLFMLGALKNANMSLPEIVDFHKLPSSSDIQGYEVLNASHVRPLTGLLNACVHKFAIKPEFDEETVKHWFFPKADLLHSYVYTGNDGSITRFCSFLTLREFRADTEVKLAYSLYNFSVWSPFQELMRDAIILARENHCDLFCACDVMGYRSFLAELNFTPISLHVQYYFNLDGISGLNPDDIGLVLF